MRHDAYITIFGHREHFVPFLCENVVFESQYQQLDTYSPFFKFTPRYSLKTARSLTGELLGKLMTLTLRILQSTDKKNGIITSESTSY